eukprot:CAMPEP_0119003756 /NCGR_PEP_ID=MMETSP1176-20130426/747_1 /TAXON_ID=265551 /ORGANISM="Synedropsis recta cf, Strain CCMP1620" /LENGTH=432 /DNA_ID=CAMNT_0006955381 /DNA_START=33 /DNA_END=1331 /DNA_ORIENTATION=+
MVNIASSSNKRAKGKISPTLILAALGTLGAIIYFATLQPDDTNLGSLLNLDLESVTSQAVYNAVSDSVSSVVSGSSSSSSSIPVNAAAAATTGGAATSRADVASDATTTTSNNPYVPSSTSGLQPVRCQELFEQGYRQAGQNKAVDEELNPNNDQIHARFTKNFTSHFWVSVHHETFDALQYHAVMDLGLYDKQALSDAAVEIVQNAPPNSRVLDVGAQVGWFSLLARGLGLEVDAFEPLRPNLFRLCESLHLNRWSNFVEKAYPGPYINVHAVALSNEGEQEEYAMKQTGASCAAAAAAVAGKDAAATGKDITVKATTLDAFVQGRGWTNEHICLLKINTMGMEDKVLTGATSLLASKMVKNVLVGIVTSSSGSGTEAVKAVLSAGYKLHKWGGGNGPHQDAGSLPTEDASSLMSALAAKGEEQVFLWFKL